VVVAPPVAKGFQVLTPPINIPDVIPKVDLSKRVTDASDFSGKGVAGGRANGDANIKTAAPISDNQTYFEFQVEKQAAAVPGSIHANYPEILKSGGGGDAKVTVQFVVDTSGRADMSTWKVLESSNDLFSQAAKDGVRGARFYPAEVGGHKVKQLVQLPITFTLTR
jgi:protein TonB